MAVHNIPLILVQFIHPIATFIQRHEYGARHRVVVEFLSIANVEQSVPVSIDVGTDSSRRLRVFLQLGSTAGMVGMDMDVANPVHRQVLVSDKVQCPGYGVS